jgi:hypothetical protein
MSPCGLVDAGDCKPCVVVFVSASFFCAVPAFLTSPSREYDTTSGCDSRKIKFSCIAAELDQFEI